MRLLRLTLVFVALTWLQGASPRKYRYYRSVSATSSKVTVRQAASGTRPLMFNGGWVKSSGACAASITAEGTVSGGTAVLPANIPLLDNRSPVATAGITLDGTVSGDTTVISEASATTVSYEGGLYFSAGSIAKQFTLAWSCGGTQTLEIYLEFNEE
jgi:hypothetical protein